VTLEDRGRLPLVIQRGWILEVVRSFTLFI